MLGGINGQKVGNRRLELAILYKSVATRNVQIVGPSFTQYLGSGQYNRYPSSKLVWKNNGLSNFSDDGVPPDIFATVYVGISAFVISNKNLPGLI